jgi:hypothetical protein
MVVVASSLVEFGVWCTLSSSRVEKKLLVGVVGENLARQILRKIRGSDIRRSVLNSDVKI